MRQFYSSLVLLCCFAMPYLASAQIGKDYRDMTTKGPVERIHYLITYIIPGADDEPSPFDHTIDAWVEDGKMMKLETERANAAFGGSITEFDWQDDVLRTVREYDKRSSSRKVLDQKHVTTVGRDGRILTENIFFDKDDLRATMQYAYSTSPAGNDVLEMTMYKPDYLDPQGYYYIESDEWGDVLHIEAVGQDTGLFLQRLESIGDSLFVSRMIVSSRRERGAKDTLTVTSLIRRDQYGNPTYTKITNRMDSEGENTGEEMTIITEISYTYEGDESADTSPAAKNVQARWINDTYNISVTLDPVGQDLRGIYTTNTLRDKDPEIVEEGSDWVFKLRNSMAGNWELNPETGIIRFFQDDHTVAELVVELSFWELTLKEDKPYSASVSFKKNR